MCEDKEHGGKRCPNDTSASRRQRRKATQIREKVAKNLTVFSGGEIGEPTVRHSQFSEEIADIRKLMNAQPGDSTQSAHDMIVEQRITQFGKAIAEEADKRAGFSQEELQAKIDDLDSLYNEVSQRREKHEQEAEELVEAIKEYCGKKGLNNIQNIRQVIRDAHHFNDVAGEKILARAISFSEEKSAISLHSHNVDKEYDAQALAIRQEANDRLTAAYQTIIAEIRPVGGSISFDASRSHPEAVSLISETVGKHYPSEWLKHHNESADSIILDSSERRAGYASDKDDDQSEEGELREKSEEEVLFTVDETDEGQMKVRNALHEVFNELQPVEYSYSHSHTGSKMMRTAFSVPPEEIYNEQVHGYMAKEELIKDGWEYRPSIYNITRLHLSRNPDEAVEMMKNPCWVKKKMTRQKKIKVLNVSNDAGLENYIKFNPDAAHPKEAVAYHEFGHRMEEVMPDNKLSRYEKAFLKRRTGKTDETFHENMVAGFGTSEIYHQGNFVYAYTGRSYLSNFHEVFTTGIEALYGGTLGGLVGNSKAAFKPDLDHRGFVLGALATL